MMYEFAKFSDGDLKECGSSLAALGGGASSMEDAANRIVNYLYDNITDSSGNKANALVRFYKTHPYSPSALEPRRQRVRRFQRFHE